MPGRTGRAAEPLVPGQAGPPADVNAKALQTYMGHQQIKITYDLYGHLLPGSEAEANRLLELYLKGQAKEAESLARAGHGATGANPAAQGADKAL